MGFFKSLVSQAESAKHTVKTQENLYTNIRNKEPGIEPHVALAIVYKSYVKTRKIFPDLNDDEIYKKSFVDTIVIAAISDERARAHALGLFLLTVSQHSDGGQINAYPNFKEEFERTTGYCGNLFDNSRKEFWEHYEKINPRTYTQIFS